MLKRLTALAVVLAVVGTGLYGQGAKPGGIARMISMGGAQVGKNLVYNPFIWSDPSWMLTNPAYASMYQDYAWTNVAGGTVNNITTANNGYGNQFSGINFGFGKEWTFGAVLSYDPSATNLLYQPNGINNGMLNTFINQVFPTRNDDVGNPAGSTSNMGPIEVFQALGSYHMGTFDLGLAVLYGWTSADNKATTTAGGTTEGDIGAHVFGLTGGILFDLGGGNMLDGSVAFRTDKATDKIIFPSQSATPGTSEFDASGTEFQLAARLKMKASNKVNFIPYAGFATVSAEPKENSVPTGRTATTASEKFSTTNFALGVGGEYHTAGYYLAGGLSYAMVEAKVETSPGGANAVTQTQTISTTGFPVFNLGSEWWFTDWLAGRMGYYRAFANTNNKTENAGFVTGTTNETDLFGGSSAVAIGGYGNGADPSLVTLGLGLKFSGFALDATVSEEALRRGLGIIGGGTDNLNTFGYVTISYNFE